MIYGLEERCQHVAVSNESEMLTFWSINTASVIVRLEDKYFIAEFIQKLRRLVTCQLPASLAMRSPLKCAPPDQNEWNFFLTKIKKKKERQTRSAFFNYFFWLWNHSGCIVVIFFSPDSTEWRKKPAEVPAWVQSPARSFRPFRNQRKKKKNVPKFGKRFRRPTTSANLKLCLPKMTLFTR